MHGLIRRPWEVEVSAATSHNVLVITEDGGEDVVDVGGVDKLGYLRVVQDVACKTHEPVSQWAPEKFRTSSRRSKRS